MTIRTSTAPGTWLALDTSGAIGVAVTDASGTAVRAARSDDRTRHHAEVLMPLIDDVLREAGARRGDLDGIVAGTGPGPFTGLRVGLVTARMIAAALDVELLGVCSLYGHALPAAERHPDAASIGIVTDARRREVYGAEFTGDKRGRLHLSTGPFVAAPDRAAADLASAGVLTGPGTALYPEALPARPAGDAAPFSAAALVRAARALQEAGEDLTATDPLYLRQADAALPTARKSALGLPPR